MDATVIIFLFALGACVGSFLNVVIYRLPRQESIVFPGSHCPRCGHPIKWYDNIPLVSWFALRGRCRQCKAPISPRYLVVEAATALRVAGLFICYYILRVRVGAGEFSSTWPMFAAHAALLCGLLVCSAVDIEHWIVPLEVCWLVTAVGLVSAAAAPHAWVPCVSPAVGAMSLAAAIGLLLALIGQHYGLIQQSFLDAEDRPDGQPPPQKQAAQPSRKKRKKGRKKPGKGAKAPAAAQRPEPKARGVAPADVVLFPLRVLFVATTALLFGSVLTTQQDSSGVGITKAHGVNPRREVLREVVFLGPAILLGVAAYLLVAKVPAIGEWWGRLAGDQAAGGAARHVSALLSALFGYLIGGLWIWGLRILGTLAFGREAMGLGDVHLLAAVGAVCGWIVPSLVFFLAAFLAVAWAVAMALRKQREMPYGPWLGAAALLVMLFYDRLTGLLEPYLWLFTGRGQAVRPF